MDAALRRPEGHVRLVPVSTHAGSGRFRTLGHLALCGAVSGCDLRLLARRLDIRHRSTQGG